MTVREWIIKRLASEGLFEDQAKAVMVRLEHGETGKTMCGRWDDPIDGYPEAFHAVLYLAASGQAVAWIDENKPKHWARPMFARERSPDRTDHHPTEETTMATETKIEHCGNSVFAIHTPAGPAVYPTLEDLSFAVRSGDVKVSDGDAECYAAREWVPVPRRTLISVGL